MNFKDIKLIIWDLDETLWQGTITEGDVLISNNIKKLINNTTDAGVINSICSKNDEKQVIERLKKDNINDLFVFNSINWSAKGSRVKQIIEEMNLRATNVLFIDDNHLNRQEVLKTCPNITVEDISIIPNLISYFSEIEKKDKEHTRLKQYKVLEKKREFKAHYSTNEDFLIESSIQVLIKDDCIKHFDRIHELISRSNQLNFTKLRSTKEELLSILNDNTIENRYISVSDKFGDYGIVGFYSLKNNSLIHFVFSCRILGMGIEQYVYKNLNNPKLNIIGSVSSKIDSPDPYWINNVIVNIKKKKKIINNKILIKGLCDMQQMFAYISDNKNIVTEFEYINKKGISIEQRNHSYHIVQSKTISNFDKSRLANELPFGDIEMYTTSMFNKDTKYIVYSLLTDPNLGLYKENKTGIIVGFGEYTNDLTNKEIWDKLIKKELFVANCSFEKKQLQKFADEFTFIGRISIDEVINNLNYIYNNISQNTYLILVLGSEKEFNKNVTPAYKDRHLYHKKLNSKVIEWSSMHDRVKLLNINNIACNDDDYTNNINHFTRNVYYKMSNELISIIEDIDGTKIKQNGEIKANLTHIKRKLIKLKTLIYSFFSSK